jgi:predicted transcriptional regulator YdeE
MKPTTTIRGLRIVGIATRTTFAAEADPESYRSGDLWARFVLDGLCYQIRRRISRIEFIELYTDYKGATHEEFTLLLGQRVFEFAAVPEGMRAIELPPQKYLKFVTKANEENLSTRLWKKVQEFFLVHPTYKRAWTTDVLFTGSQLDKVTLYIAIK